MTRFELAGKRLERTLSLALEEAGQIRDVAAGDQNVVYAVDEHSGRVITVSPGTKHGHDRRESRFVGRGAFRVARVGRYLLVACLLEHSLVIFELDRDGFIRLELGRVRHDGPIWAFDAVEQKSGEGLLIAAAGVEDHPLDRRVGSFGYVDSFVFLYELSAQGELLRLNSVNVSELGVLTPKAVHLDGSGASRLSVQVLGYGGEQRASLRWPADLRMPPIVTTHALPPGSTAWTTLPNGSLLIANPLLDAWLLASGERTSVVQIANPADQSHKSRSVQSRVGEALFFTSLMAPKNTATGPLSRFTCETCHFEGYVDGRVHHTGRGEVRVVTKPLLGLFNNRPHFSRALDRDLTQVAHNEFRVAGAGSSSDPWFSLRVADHTWLRQLGVESSELNPELLRQSLVEFLMDFTHRPNPAAIDRTAWGQRQRSGAKLFEMRCASCHMARTIADEPASVVAFERWEQLTLTPQAPIVWASADYRKTGVLPYVHELGARIPSLRRLHKKWPYFTNGSAESLMAVLERARFGQRAFYHSTNDPTLFAFTAEERSILLSFLELL